jgi:hypothetical protein
MAVRKGKPKSNRKPRVDAVARRAAKAETAVLRQWGSRR